MGLNKTSTRYIVETHSALSRTIRGVTAELPQAGGSVTEPLPSPEILREIR